MEVTTKAAEQVWASPDGQRKIFKLSLEYEGQNFEAKTYSDAISQVGWAGTVESYEKEGKMGSETFVKQPPKEGGYSRPQASGRAYGTSKPVDPFTMFLSYAKDLGIAAIKDGKFDAVLHSELLEAVAAGGEYLYNARPDAEPKAEPEDPEMESLKQSLGDIELTDEETPWDKPKKLPV